MSLAPGMLVICINEAFLDEEYPPPQGGWNRNLDGLRRGAVYTIRDIEDRYPYPDCVRLEEIVRSISPFGFECPFAACRFRPVDENRIAVFKRIAASPKERIRIGEDA